MSAYRPVGAEIARGSTLFWVLLAGLVVLPGLVSLATAAPRMAAQALHRSAEAVLVLERQARSGYITSYPVRF